jgi:hypothetical protein
MFPEINGVRPLGASALPARLALRSAEVALLVCALAISARAQTETAAANATPEVSPPPASITRDLFGPGTFERALAAAVSDQIRRFPEEWGHGATHGFGARAASEYGQVAIGNLIESGVQSLHKEDPRYFRRGSGNFFQRTLHVIGNTLVVHSTSGGRTVSLALPASAYGSWAIAARWYPAELHGVASLFQWGSANVGMKAAGNFFREFWPDMKGIFRHSQDGPLHTGSD